MVDEIDYNALAESWGKIDLEQLRDRLDDSAGTIVR